MKNITNRNFRILSDFMDVREFMVEVYERDWRNGVPAPFLEYALSSDWMDTSLMHRCRIWEDMGRIAAFVFYENPVNDIYFSLRPEYEELAREMVAYAASDMPKADGKQKLVLFEGQKAVMDAAERAGYTRCGGYNERVFDFEKSLEYPLPEGFRFVEPGKLEPEKIDECCWKGFDHEREEGPWNGDGESVRRIMAAPTLHRFSRWRLKMTARNTCVLRGCGGRRKTAWPIWSLCVRFPNTAAEGWPARRCPNCFAG